QGRAEDYPFLGFSLSSLRGGVAGMTDSTVRRSRSVCFVSSLVLGAIMSAEILGMVPEIEVTGGSERGLWVVANTARSWLHTGSSAVRRSACVRWVNVRIITPARSA